MTMDKTNDPFALHNAVLDEMRGVADIAHLESLLAAGADLHAYDSNGETPFNVAAANAPASGRIMTLFWLHQALEGTGQKSLNDPSGAHESTLAQYMAKWLHDDEIVDAFARAVAAGMRVDTANKSGWTPLMAAAAMGRVAAVRALLPHYGHAALCIQASEEYTADYGGEGRVVTYRAALNAAELAQERLFQDEGADEEFGEALWSCVEIIVAAIAEKGRGA
ncbi:MAG: ankyrin repeat domain-containing protein [Alphaproteobacteria bacterium]|nr:ankyrin repeat domain-containing protein [Alphaproteobacteria bacterium]